jgi:hypothetical protein
VIIETKSDLCAEVKGLRFSHGWMDNPLNREELIRKKYTRLFLEPGSAVGIATGYGLDGGGGRSSSSGKVKNFLFSAAFRPALGPTHPMHAMGSLSGGKATGA